MLLAVPLRWLCAWSLAAVIHEAFHCLALWICGKRVDYICIDWKGAQIHTEDLSPWEVTVCTLAGPVGSLLLLLSVRAFPKFTVCILLQSAFNLLPISSFDGGRAMRGIRSCVLSQSWVEKICNCVERVLFVALILGSFVLIFSLKLGLLPIFVPLVIATKRKIIKIPCKCRFHKVQ